MFDLITCHCCGSELTMPQYYQGKPFGYTCIKKVNPAHKASKNKIVLCEVVKDKTGSGNTRKDLIVLIAGVKLRIVAYVNADQYADDMSGSLFPLNLGTKAQPSPEALTLINAQVDLSIIYGNKK